MSNALFYKGRFFTIPSAWEQLTARQYIKCIDVLILQKGTTEQKQLKLLKIISGISWISFAIILGWFSFNPFRLIRTSFKRLASNKAFGPAMDRTERLATAAEDCTAFLFAECNLTKNILPKVKGLIGPAHYLDNLRMAEFIYAETYFTQWKQNGEHATLNKLISVLYRQPGTTGTTPADKRQPFDPVLSAQQLPRIERWPLRTRVAIATMYGSMRQALINENPRVFTDNGTNQNESVYGMWSVMRAIAKEGHFGTFSSVENTYVSTILMELNESIIEAERMEEKMDAFNHQS